MLEIRLYEVEENKTKELKKLLGNDASICNADENTYDVIISVGIKESISIKYSLNVIMVHYVKAGTIREFKLKMDEFRFIEMI